MTEPSKKALETAKRDIHRCTMPICAECSRIAIALDAYAAVRVVEARAVPINMVMFCPACGFQHVDAPEPEKGWANPPHKTHECHRCGHLFRPASVPTNGVQHVDPGSSDTLPQVQGEMSALAEARAQERERCAAWIDCGGPAICQRTTLKDGSCIDALCGQCPHALAQDIRALTEQEKP